MIFANIATAATLLFGVFTLVKPSTLADAVSIDLSGARGKAEFRIGFGGFYTGMALAALLLQSPPAFLVLGAAWFGGALARLAAIVIDRPDVGADYVGYLVLEIVMGVFLLIPTLA